jgi:GNAT superfamily N-acetyltransferase
MARLARAGDRGFFERHLRAYLIERHSCGSEVIPTDRTVAFYLGLFDDYIRGEQPGAVVIDEAGGVSIAGHELPFDTTLGKSATGWFTYVVPSSRGCGVASAMREILRERLRALGFRAIVAGMDISNADGRQSIASRPMKWTQVYGHEELF